MSTIKVNTLTTLNGSGNITVSRPLSGSGASLTDLPAANLTGTLPAISATNLTNLPAANLTGTLPAISGANLTNLPAGGVDGITSSANATAISISADEEVTMPKQPCVIAYQRSGQNAVTGDGTQYTLQFTTEITDQNGDFDGTSTFTAPVTGQYFVSASGYLSGMTTSNTSLQWKYVTSNRTYHIQQSNTSNWIVGDWKPTGSLIVDMDASDTLTITYTHSGPSKNMNVYADTTGNVYTWLTIVLVC
jgi:hypothetical protein